MAVIGHAEVIVTPITKGFEAALRRDLNGMRGVLGAQGRRTGQGFGEALQEGINRSFSNNIFGKFADGLRNAVPEAEAAREKFQSLVRVGYVLQGVIGPLIGGLSSLVVSLGTLVGVLAKAAPAVAVLANGFVLLQTAVKTAKFAFGDIASAVKQATEPNKALGKSIAEIREEFQQLVFDAEQAALSEGRAALNLEKALENLQRTADLPPNSAARREAQLAYEEAELAYRRAKDRTQDLNAEVAKGPEALNKAAAGSDPYAGLNEAQEAFARKLVELKPLIDDLELALSKAFLPPLERAVDILVRDLYPVLQRRLPSVAKQAGEAIEGIVGGLDESKIDRILEGFTKPFEGKNRSNLELFGDLLGNVLDIFLTITEATGPLLSDLLTFLVDKTTTWGTKLEEMDLEGFFGEAGGVMGQLGEILGNIFEGIGNLAELTTGPGSAGQEMLNWMKDSTETFANMFSEDPEAGKKFFYDAFVNAREVMSSIGALLQEIFKLADNPNIGETFKTLKEGAPALGEMLGKMIDAGPSFAEFIKTLTEIANELTDSEQIKSFFDTLNEGATRFKDFIQTDTFKRLLDTLGPIFAKLSAIGVMFDVLKFGFFTLVGFILVPLMFLDKFFSLFKDGPKKIGPSVGGIGKLIRGAGIVGAIVFAIEKTSEFYGKFADFREMFDTTLGGVKDSFDRLMQPLSDLFTKVFGGEGGGGLLGALDPVVKILLEFIIPGLGNAISFLLDLITFVLDLANTLLDAVMPIIEDVANAIGALFEGDIQGFFENMFSAIGNIIPAIAQMVVNGVIDLFNWMIRNLNNMVAGIANTPFGSFLKDVLGIDLGNFKLGEIQKVNWVADNQAQWQKTANSMNGMYDSNQGSDRRFTSMATGNNATNYAKNSISGMNGFQDYMAGNGGGVTINQNNYIETKDPLGASAVVDRTLADGIRRGGAAVVKR